MPTHGAASWIAERPFQWRRYNQRRMARNIVLIGFMGTGKSAVGRKLAQMTHRSLIDVDKVIEQEQACTVSELFAEQGEAVFRALETETIARLSERRNIILSTGGGAPTLDENVRLLKRNGVIVRLTARPETILKRVQPLESRPLLSSAPDPLATIRGFLEARELSYARAADVTVSTDDSTVAETAAAILRAVNDG